MHPEFYTTVRAEMARGHIPGLSLAIVRGGKVVHAAAYGRAHLEWPIDATPDTVYEIGSITKQMTATGLMMLWEAGKIDLDASLRRYLPDAPPEWEPITVRHLLTHTSGLPNYTDLPGFTMREGLDRAAFLTRLSAYPLGFEPGAQFLYNNSGYNLLGEIIAAVSGESYRDFLQARILGPLGMADTRPRNPRDIIPRRAAGYIWEDGRYRNRDSDLSEVLAAGFLVSTVFDLAKWDAALATDKLVSRATLERMWTPHTLPDGSASRYGFGWGLGETNGHRFINHGGSTSGYSAAMRRFPDLGLTMIVLTNTETDGAALDLAKALLPLIEPQLAT